MFPEYLQLKEHCTKSWYHREIRRVPYLCGAHSLCRIVRNACLHTPLSRKTETWGFLLRMSSKLYWNSWLGECKLMCFKKTFQWIWDLGTSKTEDVKKWEVWRRQSHSEGVNGSVFKKGDRHSHLEAASWFPWSAKGYRGGFYEQKVVPYSRNRRIQ